MSLTLDRGGQALSPQRIGRLRTAMSDARRPLAAYAVGRVITLLAAVFAGIGRPGYGLTDFFSTWDGQWYLRVVTEGYPAQIPEIGGRATETTIGFFPFYPLTIRWTSWLLPLSDVVAGILISTMAGAVAIYLVFRLALRITDRAAAERAAVLFALFPGAFLFSMTYTEPLMLALAAGCLLSLLQGRWVAAGLLAAVAAATRPNALALVVACGWQALVVIRARREWRALAAPLLAPSGMIAYFGYLWWRTGEHDAWFRVEREAWAQGPKLGWGALQPAFDFVQNPFAGHNEAIIGLGLLFAAAGLFLLLRHRWPGALTVYVAVVLFMGANSRLDAVRPRALLTAFPLIMVAGALAKRPVVNTWVVRLSALTMFLLAVGYNTFKLGQI